jgi:hypothetical protein
MSEGEVRIGGDGFLRHGQNFGAELERLDHFDGLHGGSLASLDLVEKTIVFP